MASKSKQRRRVLGASCILAALIVAGSSFAWFTSADEVVNKLSAENTYNVVITEDFTPPPPDDPWTPGEKITKKAGVVNTGNVNSIVSVALSSKISVVKKELVASTAVPGSASASTKTYKELTDAEVTALQSGGRLVYTSATTADGAGVYVYHRAETGVEEKDYVAYYKVAAAAGDKYYAVDDIHITIDDTTGDVTRVTYQFVVFSDAIVITDTGDNKFSYSINAAGNIEATVDVDGNVATTDDVITIIIERANIGTTGDTWTQLSATEYGYNQILAAGKKSSDFILSATLSADTKKEAFVSFDYDLTIKSKSAQEVEGDDPAAAYKAEYNASGRVEATPSTKDASGDVVPGTVTWTPNS